VEKPIPFSPEGRVNCTIEQDDARRWSRLGVTPWAAQVQDDTAAGDIMARLIEKPTVIAAAGNKPKRIEEFVGRVNTGMDQVSIAHMHSSPGWEEPGQTPEFEEYTLVLAGLLRVETQTGALEVRAGQAVHAPAGQWVRYSTPGPEGADYVSVCVQAFSPQTVHRDS
jgi:mannose-6-phosphate isomerase-like protein (cupin superfamily)